MFFDEFDLEDEVLDGLDAMHFSEATPVQEATIPLLLEGKDMIACAQTGTGKTAAYILPIINKLSRGLGVKDRVNAVIMAPTRELALQIEQQVEGFAYFLPISSVAIYGGTDGIAFAQQQRGLNLGADIVIATPGRLLSLLSLSNAELSDVSYFVLDEADRMLDMGFSEDILEIRRLLPQQCQTVMFSATMPPKIKKFARTILQNPAEVELAISRPPESIRQSAYICKETQKMPILMDIFARSSAERSIVFSSRKQKVKELYRALKGRGIKVEEMHSDLEQSAREEVMRNFKNGTVDLLVATDIVARGIDIDNIRMVINYDVPRDPEDYVHRIGRTARGTGEAGEAITFVSPEEQRDFHQIETFLGYEVLKQALPEGLGDAPEYKPERREQKGGRSHSSQRSKRPGRDPQGQKPSGAQAGSAEQPRPKRKPNRSKRSAKPQAKPE